MPTFRKYFNRRLKWERLASVGGAFMPASIASLVNWYNSPIAGQTNGNPISGWVDSKGSNNLTAAGLAPTYKTSQQNGLDAVQFVAASSMNLTTGGSTASSFPYTFFAVFNLTDITSGHVIFAPSGTGGINLIINQTTGFAELQKGNVAIIGTATSGFTSGSWHTLIATVDSSTYAFYIDGVLAGSGSHSQTLTGGLTIQMGVQEAALSYFNGYIGEAGICNAVISSGDRSSLYSYLKARWNTP